VPEFTSPLAVYNPLGLPKNERSNQLVVPRIITPLNSVVESLGPILYMQRFQSLQAFRGVAALAVVVFHTAVFYRERTGISLMKGAYPGCSGVDFFFVLSGFIIYNSHVRDFGRPARLPDFLFRRFIRVYPLFFLLSSLMLLLYAFHLGHFSKLRTDVIVKSFFLFPQTPGVRPLLNPSWTLCYEMLFYALFGVFILVNRRQRLSLLAAMVLLTGINCVAPVPGPYWLKLWLLSPYNLEFLAGCVASRLSKNYEVAWALPLGASVLLLNWIYASVKPGPIGDAAPVHMVLYFGVPYFLIVMGAASAERRRDYRIPALLTVLGDASYSIYLVHFLVATALMSVFVKLPQSPYLSIVEVSILATASGYLLYLLVERPLLRWMRQAASRRDVRATTLSLAE
jgi:peptidoglycan/LPS O-acetylase OafA/YrhL